MPRPAARSGMIGDPSATMDPAVADQMLAVREVHARPRHRLPRPEVRGRRGVGLAAVRTANGGIDPTPTSSRRRQEACGAGPARRWAGLRERAGDPGEAVRRAIVAGAGLALVVAAGALAGTSGALGGLALPGRRVPRPARRPARNPTPVDRRRSSDGRCTRPRSSTARSATRARPVLAGTPGTVTRLPTRAGSSAATAPVRARRRDPAAPCSTATGRCWRPLGPGIPDGADIRQLEVNLKALGYAPKGMKVDRPGTRRRHVP